MHKVKKMVRESYDSIINWRRSFYMQPELGRDEYKTQELIVQILSTMGLKTEKKANTGVVCSIIGEKPGKVVAIRADMDALPVDDALQKSYKSKVVGIKHACGHDGHMAMLLGIGKIFKELQSRLTGEIRLIFQPDEEGRGGAEKLIEEGTMEGVDYVLGAHLWPTIEVGKIGITYGAMMASSDEFEISIKGRGGHASMPHDTADALHAGVQIIAALKQLRAQNIDPLESALLAIGSFNAGETYNVLPDAALIRGSIRSYSEDTRNNMIRLIEKTIAGMSRIHDVECYLEIFSGYIPVINDRKVAEKVKLIGEKALGTGNVLECRPSLASEDFSYYQRKAPGCFIWVGSGDKKSATDYPLHHPLFDIDERALENGVLVMLLTAMNLLGLEV